MNTNIIPKAGGFNLLVCPQDMKAMMLTVIAKLGQGSQTRVVDCGNRFNAYGVARAAGGRSEVLKRITVARAFTCHQVVSLLESTLASREPFVVLDLLHTFYDESVRPGERKWLLKACIAQLERLQKAAGGVVSVHPPAVASQTAVELLEILRAASADVYYIQPAEPVIEQMGMF